MYKEIVLLYLEEGRRQINSHCAHLEPWQIIGATVITTLGAIWAKGFLFQQESNLLHVTYGYKGDLLETKSEMTVHEMSSAETADAMLTKLFESYCNLQSQSLQMLTSGLTSAGSQHVA